MITSYIYNIANSILSISSKENRDLFEWQDKHRTKIYPFHNKHLGDTCVIWGNGPSLNDMDLEVFKGMINIGANRIIDINDRISYSHDYLIVQDAKMFEIVKDDLMKSVSTKFLSYKIWLDLKKNEKKKFIPLFIRGNGLEFQKDLKFGWYSGFTVLFTMLGIASLMGFSRIILIGVDFTLTNKGKISKHENKLSFDEDVDHFFKGYYSGKVHNDFNREAAQAALYQAKYFLESRGIEIYNFTCNSELEVFKKIDRKEQKDILFGLDNEN
jgi:hypothetical protein